MSLASTDDSEIESSVACLLEADMHSPHSSELCPNCYQCVQVIKTSIVYEKGGYGDYEKLLNVLIKIVLFALL